MFKSISEFFRRPPALPDATHVHSEIRGELAAQEARNQAIRRRSEAIAAKTQIVLSVCEMVIEGKRGRND